MLCSKEWAILGFEWGWAELMMQYQDGGFSYAQKDAYYIKLTNDGKNSLTRQADGAFKVAEIETWQLAFN